MGLLEKAQNDRYKKALKEALIGLKFYSESKNWYRKKQRKLSKIELDEGDIATVTMSIIKYYLKGDFNEINKG